MLLAYIAMVVAREQRRARDAAIKLSSVDSLTGLFNRAYFFAALDREIERSARSRRGFCLLMLDLDGLKPINDQFGHFEGDRVLRGVGEIIRDRRPADRHGGPLRRRRVRRAAARDRAGRGVCPGREDPVGRDRAVDRRRTIRIRTSLSIGVVTFPDDGRTADELMIAADLAMYASKRRGKNRIVAYRRGVAAQARRTGTGTPGGATRRGPRPERVRSPR